MWSAVWVSCLCDVIYSLCLCDKVFNLCLVSLRCILQFVSFVSLWRGLHFSLLVSLWCDLQFLSCVFVVWSTVCVVYFYDVVSSWSSLLLRVLWSSVCLLSTFIVWCCFHHYHHNHHLLCFDSPPPQVCSSLSISLPGYIVVDLLLFFSSTFSFDFLYSLLIWQKYFNCLVLVLRILYNFIFKKIRKSLKRGKFT